MAGPQNNIPLRAKRYLESGIGLIITLTLTHTRGTDLGKGWKSLMSALITAEYTLSDMHVSIS